MEYKKMPLSEFMNIYHKVPRLAVELTVVSGNGFVLTKRSIPPFKGMWHLPGGTVLFKEPIKHAIARVAKEELGIRVTVIKNLGTQEYFNDGGRHTVCIEFLAKAKTGKLRGGEQGEEVGIFQEIPQRTISQQKKFIAANMTAIKKAYNEEQ